MLKLSSVQLPATDQAACCTGLAAARAASAAALLAQMLEYYRGSRVEDYGPIFSAAAAACASAAAAADSQHQPVEQAGLPGLAGQLLRMLSALLIAHAKVRGPRFLRLMV